MVNVELIRDLDFPAEQVWAVLGDYGNLEWAMAPKVEVIGEGIGMIRRVLIEGMDPIDEVLEAMDPAGMSFAYSIPRGLPLPLTDYRSSARVEAKDDGSARVHWSCQCTPTDPAMSEQDTEQLMQNTYNSLLDSLAAFLGRQDSN
jgi:hypothetical protein